MAEDKCCFVIAPIGEQGSETRKRSDQVLKHVIKPAVDSCGYTAIRADEIDKPGIITSQVIQHVVNDPLVVADLTERNPNVFYELAIRHALRRPLVQLMKKGEQIPFDVAATRTIHVDHHDLDSVEAAKNEIVNQIHALEKDATDIETPISTSLDLQLLRQSEKPEERSLADLVAAVSDLRSGLGKLETKIGTSDEEGALDKIQSAIKALPQRLDEQCELFGSFSRRRRRRFHPMMFQELMDRGSKTFPALGILVVSSFFRDALPWVYELGLETYRLARHADPQVVREALNEFRQVIEFSTNGPWGGEFMGHSSEEMSILMEELEPILEHTMWLIEERHRPGQP